MRFLILPFSLFLLASSSLSAACVPGGGNVAPGDPGQNPLYVETLADERIDFLVAMAVDGISDPAVRRAHERALAEAQRLQKWAHEMQDQGEKGHFVSDDYVVEGRTLVLANAVHLGSDFVSEVAPGLRIALSKVLIPKTYDDFMAGEHRDVAVLQSFIGPQSYRLSPAVTKNEFSTVVLYAPELKVVIGFAQI